MNERASRRSSPNPLARLAVLALVAALLGVPKASRAAFPGDNGRIAFTSARDNNGEIYAMSADGGGQTNVTNNPAADSNPAWSPDGRRIAFTSTDSGSSNDEIFVMSAAGNGQTNLTNHPGQDLEPAWSPDGSQIAFTSYRDGNPQIYVMNADGSGQTNLTNSPGFDMEPAWSPDGTKIAFVTFRDFNWEIYVMNADGSGQTNITNNAGADFLPDWSPDGSKIAFMSQRDGNDEIYVMNADGTGQTNLTNNPATDNNPAWSPDGQRIAFDTDRDGNSEIYSMNAGGSGQTDLTNNPAFDGDPSWQPAPVDQGPTVSIENTSVTEGDAGGITAQIHVSLSAPSDTRVTVDWAATTAPPGVTPAASASGPNADFQTDSGQLVFDPGGPTTQTINVTINGDLTPEHDEYFAVSLTNATGAQLATAPDDSARVRIRDDDLGVFIGNDGTTYDTPEGDTGTTALTIPVRLNFASPDPVTVHWATAPTLANPGQDPREFATANADYVATEGTLTFNPGETEKSVEITIIGDTLPEFAAEHFQVMLTGIDGAEHGVTAGGSVLGAPVAIIDDDPPTISVDDVSVPEGDTGTSTATFTLTRSSTGNAQYPNPVSVDWTTESDSATAGSDFTAASGTATFDPNSLTTTVGVPITGDLLAEPDETFKIRLSNPQHAVIDRGVGTGTIANDDPQPSDTVPPVTTATFNSAGDPYTPSTWTDQTVTVALSCADNDGGSGCSETEYNLDGSGWTPYSGSFAVSTVGQHALEYRSRDAADNVEAVNEAGIWITTAAKLEFISQPSGGVMGRPFATQPAVVVEDFAGHVITGDTSILTLSITPFTGSAGALLRCNDNPLAASSGVASFAGCAIDTPGTLYSLQAEEPGLASAHSAPFDVAGPPTAEITAPADGGTYRLNESIVTGFACTDDAAGPGIASCVDSNGAPGPAGAIDTSRPGALAYTVTATSKDDLVATAQIHYTVLAPQTIRFTSTPPADAAVGDSYSVTATGGASGNPVIFSIDPLSGLGSCALSAGTVAFTGPGVCVIDANQAGNAAYEAAPQAQQSFTISRAAQAVTFPDAHVVYGQADFSPASASSGLPVTYTDPSGQCAVDPAGLVQITGAGSCTITANQPGNLYFAAATPVTQTFAVDQAPLFVNAEDATTVFGQNPTLDYSLDGFVNGENVNSARVSGGADCKASAPSRHPGTYPGAIICAPGTLSAPNYRFFTNASGTLTITQGSQSIEFPATTVLSTHPDFSPASTSSGLPITYINPSGQCAVDSQGLVQVTGGGSCTVTASQAGNADYRAATPLTQTFAIIGPPTARISSPAGGQTYTQGQAVPTSFACNEAPGGPGIGSCTDSNGATAGTGTVDTSATGTHSYTVTATSQDGLTGTATIQYTVVSGHAGIDHLVWSPDPVAPGGSLGSGGSANVTVTAVDAGGQPVQAGVRGMQIFVSLRLAAAGGGRGQGSNAKASCGGTNITVAGVFCQVPAGGVAQIQVRYTSSVSSVTNASDAVVAALDAYGSKQAEDRYGYPAPAGTRVDHLQWSPDPIASHGSLRAGDRADATVTAYSSNDGPIPGVSLRLLLGSVNGTSTATASCGTIPTTAPGRLCSTGPDGSIKVTYQAPLSLPNGGSDALTATSGGPSNLQVRDLYSFGVTVDHLVWSPDPVAPGGSLGSGGSANVTVTAVDAGGQPVQAGVRGMQIFVSLRLAAAGGGRGQGSNAKASCGGTNITVAGVFCQVPAGGVAQIQVRYTSSVSSVTNASDAVVAALDAYGSKQAEDRYGYPAPAGTRVDHLQWSPDPIASHGSLRAGDRADATVTAYSSNDGPIPGVSLRLLLGSVNGTSTATASCGTIPTTAPGRLCSTGPDGSIKVTYQAPLSLPNGGSDALTATSGGPSNLQVRDLYSFGVTVDHLVWSPDPVAPGGAWVVVGLRT